MSGLLNTPEIINANMQKATRLITEDGAIAGNIDTVDNADIRAAGMVRHIRRIILQNTENNVHEVNFGTCSADDANGVAVNFTGVQVTNFGTVILEPEKPGDDLFMFVRAATVLRFGAQIDAAPAGGEGVRIQVWYYDDVG